MICAIFILTGLSLLAQGRLGDEIDLLADKLPEGEFVFDDVEETLLRAELHEDIYIAVGSRLPPPRVGAENGDLDRVALGEILANHGDYALVRFRPLVDCNSRPFVRTMGLQLYAQSRPRAMAESGFARDIVEGESTRRNVGVMRSSRAPSRNPVAEGRGSRGRGGTEPRFDVVRAEEAVIGTVERF